MDTNLKAERFRLVFVSDSIGAELRRIIEFLNGQMSRTEVLAIEVKQYTDARRASDDRAARRRRHGGGARGEAPHGAW